MSGLFIRSEFDEPIYRRRRPRIQWAVFTHARPFHLLGWHARGQLDANWGEMTEEKRAELLAEPQYGARGVVTTIPEEIKQRIIKMLHYILNEKPDPREWVN